MKDPHAQKILKSLTVLINRHETIFPPDRNEIMPTPFGNMLKAAEFYSSDRYHLDSVIFWPSLIHAIEPSYNVRIQETRNQLSFVINTSLLSIVFGLFCWIAVLYQAGLCILLENEVASPLYFIEINLAPHVYVERMVIYFLVGTASFVTAVILYRASLVSVGEFGGMIRSSYDLFRFDLLRALHLPLPDNSQQERILWLRIGDLVKKGYYWDKKERQPFTYEHPNPPQENSPQSSVQEKKS